MNISRGGKTTEKIQQSKFSGFSEIFFQYSITAEFWLLTAKPQLLTTKKNLWQLFNCWNSANVVSWICWEGFFFTLLNNHCRLNFPILSFSSWLLERIAVSSIYCWKTALSAVLTAEKKSVSAESTSFGVLSVVFDRCKP